MIRVSEENNSCDNSSCSADPCPNSIGSPDGDGFHRLRDGEEAEHNKNHRDDAGNELGKTLTVLECDSKANLKKPGE